MQIFLSNYVLYLELNLRKIAGKSSFMEKNGIWKGAKSSFGLFGKKKVSLKTHQKRLNLGNTYREDKRCSARYTILESQFSTYLKP